MGTAPLAPGTTDPHEHCPCVELWRHILSGNAETSHVLRIWVENTYLLERVRTLQHQVHELEQRAAVRPKRA